MEKSLYFLAQAIITGTAYSRHSFWAYRHFERKYRSTLEQQSADSIEKYLTDASLLKVSVMD